jgi:GNAT superfamily N-acetyltransferase
MRIPKVRIARKEDLAEISRFDRLAKKSERKRRLLECISARNLLVAEVGGRVVAYIEFDHAFYGRGFVHLLFVDESFRRAGVASILMRRAENRCRTSKIFTSTNASNRSMHNLLRKLRYEQCGKITELDPGDPEIVYFKTLK